VPTDQARGLVEKHIRRGEECRVITPFEAAEFAAHTFGCSSDQVTVEEMFEWERRLAKGKDGPQMYLVMCDDMEYVVKVSFREKEFAASRKMLELRQTKWGDMRLLFPIQFAIYNIKGRRIERYIDILNERDFEAIAVQFQGDIAILQITERVPYPILGDILANCENFSVGQLFRLGESVGQAVANLHKIGDEGNAQSTTAHNDMHPGQVFVPWDFKRGALIGREVTIIDFDRMRRNSVVVDFYRIIGRVMKQIGSSHSYVVIAYVWGFLFGYRRILPEALNLNYDDKYIELFSAESILLGSILVATVRTFFTLLYEFPDRPPAPSIMDVYRALLMNAPSKKRQSKLEQTGLVSYEPLMRLSSLIEERCKEESLTSPSLIRVIEELSSSITQVTQGNKDELAAVERLCEIFKTRQETDIHYADTDRS
jgi:hypothetical protein